MTNCDFRNNAALGTDINRKIFDLTSLSQIINGTTLPSASTDKNKIYVYIQYNGAQKAKYTMYVYYKNAWTPVEFTTETGPSTTDWVTDEYFGGDGGTIFWRGDNGTVDNCNFYDSNSARRGGGAYMTGSDHITFKNSYFENCTSGTNGGGLDWLAGANYGKVINCTFNNTRAARSAGAIYYDGDYGRMINITIINATNNGGALKQSKDGRVKYAGWDASHWDTNTTGGDAGAIMFTGNHEYIYNATFINCTSVGRGGAVFLQDNHNVTFDSCNFINNYAKGTANNTWANYTQERDDSHNDTKVDYKLTGHGGGVAFDVNAKACKLLNSNFTNNLARRNGGAVNFDQGSIKNTIVNCNFDNNTVYDDGGAINFDHGSDLCSVYNSTFYNNTGLGRFGSTTKGGTICLTGSNITISESKFILGTAYANTTEGAKLNQTDGGALFVTGNHVNITDTEFINCTSPNQAGAIKILGNETNIVNCTFKHCNAHVEGGAIVVEGINCTLYNSTFENIISGDDGGAILWVGERGLIYNSTFTSINALGLDGHHSKGGSINIIGDYGVVTKSKFNMTSASVDGGAIYVTGNYVNITDSSFDRCNVSTIVELKYNHGGGSIYVQGNNSFISNCTFDRNHAKLGGVMFIEGHNAIIDNITSNRSYVPSSGGAIFVHGDNAIIKKSNIVRTNASVDGGAIYIHGANTNITGTTISMCFADDEGGAIYVNGTDATIEYCKISKSNATNGGSIYIMGDDAEIINSTLMQSHADVKGGVIYVEGQRAIINQSSLAMSSALTGGAIYVEGNNAVIEGSSFDKTNATTHGGAIFVEGDNTQIKDSNFTINIALTGDGGAIYVGGAIAAKNTVISGIKSSITQAVNGQGGCVYINGPDTTIKDSDLAMSHSGKEGGAVYINGLNAKINNTNISRTSSNLDGGAVYINKANAIIENSNIKWSNATRYGGGICIVGDKAIVKNSTFNWTYAKKSSTTYANDSLGGAIYIDGKNTKIEDSKFENSSAYRGGMIYLKGTYCNVINSSLTNGYSFDDGGAFYSTGSNSNVYDSNFTNNEAKGDGGAIYWSAAKYNDVVGCIFTNNTAHSDPGHGGTKGGGAIYFSENGANCNVKNSKFFNNSAQTSSKADGGAILWDKSSNCLIDNCLFDGNYATTTKPTGNWVQGGVLYARPTSNFIITNSVFQNCWSLWEAGALYLQQQGTANKGYTLINNTFINNTAKGNTTGSNNLGGGAILLKDLNNAEFINNTFINNTANFGGAISYVTGSGTITMINSTFDANKAIFGGLDCGKGGAIYTAKPLTLNNATFSNGEAAYTGGGIFVANVLLTYTNLTFINNSAGVYGGGLFWNKSGVTIDRMNFINNSANNGGAIYIPTGGSSSAPTKVSNSNFTGNSAENGGAIHAVGAHILISNNNFINNSTSLAGGAIFTPVSSNGVDIGYSNFTGNTGGDGGAIYAGSKGSTNPGRYIHDCNFINNSGLNGGAVYIAQDNQKIVNCNFTGNNATENGGAVYIMNGLQSVSIESSRFENSYAARDGGAVYYDGAPSSNRLIIKDSDFIKNTAVHNGGAVLYITNSGINKYRDYNNFDGIGIISNTGRTTVKFNGTTTEFIQNCLFEENEDYILRLKIISDWEHPLITIYLDNPRDWKSDKLKFVVSLTNSTTHEVIQTIIVNASNIDTHYRDGMLYVVFDDVLLMNQTYNITVSFEDRDYMLKGNSSLVQSHGVMIGPFRLLQSLIDEAVSRGDPEIYLNRSFTFTPEYQGIKENMDNKSINLTNINYPFTIHGEGFRIDAAGYARIFYITSPNVTIENVVLVGGNPSGEYGDRVYHDGDMGGAIFWAGANGTLIGSLLEKNNASRGGGIYYNVTAPDCKIINTTFTSNTAVTNGGAIDCNASRMELINTTFEKNFAYIGAALCREINATEGKGFNNTFSDNYAEYAGAALAWINATSISIDTYYFYNNHVGYSGGAIYVGEGSKNALIKNCVFDNNWVENDADGHGGAIEWYSEKGIVYNSIFTNNRAYDGGAIYVGSKSGEINITNSTFRYNHAITTGGAVSINASAVTVNASNFYYNDAVRGGALFVGGNGTSNYIYSSVFEGNKAIGELNTTSGQSKMNGLGGAIDWVASSGYIYNSNFTSNCADYGGGIYFGGKSNESVIDNCLFENNKAKYNGGAIDCNASKMYLTNTIFDANVAQFGAALCRETNAQSGSGENNTFKNNHAIVTGAALAWMGSIGIKIVNYTFINNYADVAGGAIYASVSSDNCSIIDCNFVNNYVTDLTDGWVGGEQFNWIAWDGSLMYYLTDSTTDPSIATTAVVKPDGTIFYYQNAEQLDVALGTGGAITIFGANSTILNTNFTGGSARLGGGVYVGAYSGSTIINKTIFKSNTARERGGGLNLHASAVHIDYAQFYNNYAVNGSGVYVGGVGTSNKVHESIFKGNNASGYGAGIYWVAYEGEIVNSTFNDNSALYGGGIYLNGRSANTNITNTTFTKNSAIKNGGAIECNASNIGIYNLIFDSNTAGEYGAALCREINATGGHGLNNTFKSNHAGISGAALAWLGVDHIHIINYTFIDNTAERSGGAIYIDVGSNNDIIENCTFEGNHLTNMSDEHFGGAIDCQGDNLTLKSSSFTNNRAHTGGAIYVGSTSQYVRVFDSNFTKNYAEGDGGALGLKASSLSINNTIFKSNTAERHGGALYAGGNGTNNTISYTLFEKNIAGDHGGAINWLASAGDFKYINFTLNEAKYGGGIYLNGVSSNTAIVNVIFEYNKATKNGGAIDCNASKMGLNNTIFRYNEAGEYGAALCREANATGGYGGNNTFIANYAKISGAALAWLGVDGISINNYTFIDNKADESGGAIYVRNDSPNCVVRNSYFKNNYVTDKNIGEGGSIDWLGANGTVVNSTFLDSFANYGGTLHIGHEAHNISISYSNFSFSNAFTRGGAIGGHADNASIDNCIFNYTVAAGFVDSSLKVHGEGGAIYWLNANNFTVSNSKFLDLEARSNGGAISLLNVSNSGIYNATFKGELSNRQGGSISWINSTNATVDSCNFTASAASYAGGAIYLYNMGNTTVKNSKFNNTSTPWGNGGAIYINGNLTVDNCTFKDYSATEDYAGGIFMYSGNITVSNSSFTDPDPIWVNKTATVYLINNIITGPNPNKNITYLEKAYDARYNKYDYSVWNDGDLYLDNNTFDYIIFNNGTIWTNTTTWIIGNQTWNETWNETFTFFANITDDNSNTIISVHTLDTWNDVFPYDPHYPMPYNALPNTRMKYQGNFTIFGNDTGLMNNKIYYGHVNVKMPNDLTVNYSKEVDEKIDFTVKISTPVQSNYTFDTSKLVIKINDKVIPNSNITFYGNGSKWSVVYANFTMTHMRVGTYTITAEYLGDTFHDVQYGLKSMQRVSSLAKHSL